MLGVLKVLLLVIVLFTTECLTKSDDENPVVSTKNGLVMGRTGYTVGQNKKYYAFQGIPFAEPPLGPLRFKAPNRVSNWNGTLRATADKSECVQGIFPVVGAEDCLYINVYTTKLGSANLSVMAWIYGGAFISGNSSYKTYGPDYLLDEDIVFVSFNYRLGIFGFLSTGDEVCSGNWGLKDQVLALEWVQDNIAYFGGNPSNVTIFGQSAGGASVSYLLQTNKTKGLFTSAIMHSATSMNLWALSRKAKKLAFSVAKTFLITSTNSSIVVAALRNVEYKQLQTIAFVTFTAFTLDDALAGLNYGPVIEPDYDGALFVNKSEELLSQGGFHRIPTIMGFTSNEASAFGDIPRIIMLALTGNDLEPQKYAPVDLTNKSSDRLAAGVKIKMHYFGLIGAIVASRVKLVQFVSDDQFNRPIRKAVLDQSKYAPVYCYEFSYEGLLGGVKDRMYPGVGHAEDIGYLFRTYNITRSKKDELVRARMVKMWTNFAKYGNPTARGRQLLQNVTWKIAGSNASALNYLNIDSDLKMSLNPFNKAMMFYDKIYQDYGKPPYDTY